MSSGDEFVDVDMSDLSSSDDSDLDELLQDDDMEATVLLLSVKELEDRAKLLIRERPTGSSLVDARSFTARTWGSKSSQQRDERSLEKRERIQQATDR
jgi:hypothetical protein